MERLPKFPEEHQLAQKLKTVPALIAYEKFSVGILIKKARLKAKIKQSEFARMIGTSQSTVARIEAGKQNLTLATLTLIAHHLGKRPIIKFQ